MIALYHLQKKLVPKFIMKSTSSPYNNKKSKKLWWCVFLMSSNIITNHLIALSLDLLPIYLIDTKITFLLILIILYVPCVKSEAIHLDTTWLQHPPKLYYFMFIQHHKDEDNQELTLNKFIILFLKNYPSLSSINDLASTTAPIYSKK